MDLKIATFYKFHPLQNLPTLKTELLKYFQENNLKGTIILAEEGINGSMSSTQEGIDALHKKIQEIVSNDFSWKVYNVTNQEPPFMKTKVKIKPEIVTFKKQIKSTPGKYLSNQEWDDLISDKKTITIDTRNTYEYQMGTFENAIDPQTIRFSELPNWVEQNLSQTDKSTPIAMFCTGGIRCEKSTAYMKDLGFKNVYHLKNGILGYLDRAKQENRPHKWQGGCFVFDERTSVDDSLATQPHGTFKFSKLDFIRKLKEKEKEKQNS